MDIKVNYHSSVLINDEIYVDPLKIEKTGNAKYIFITHPHWDHFSVKDIQKVVTDSTIFICPKSMQNEIKQFSNNVILVEPDNNYNVNGLRFSAFSSYNINKQFHPKQNGWVGYNIEIEKQNVVIAGDTDDTPDLRKQKADILLLPIGGTYTMNIDDAVDVANYLKPKKVIPIHYGDVVGSPDLGKQFKKLIDKKIQCEILL